MPGLTGYMRLRATEELPPPLSVLTEPLRHDSTERVLSLVVPKRAELAVVDLGLRPGLAGTVHLGARGLYLAFQGELDNDGLESCREPGAILEKLADLYEQHGEALPERLRGTFLVFLYDERRDLALFANDHYASRPLFYAARAGWLLVAPEVKTFREMPGGTISLDGPSFLSFLVNGHLLSGRTYLEGVSALPASSVLRVQGGEVTVSCHHEHLLHGESVDRGESSYVEELAELVTVAVRRRFRDPERTVIPISGGWDSRAILACARRLHGGRLQTVSWGVSEDEPGADAAIGRQIASRLGTEHHFLRRERSRYERLVVDLINRTDGQNDDPVFHASELAVLRRIRRELGASHLLRGDECFGFTAGTSSALEALGRVGIYSLDDARPIESLLHPDRRQALREAYDAMVRGVLEACPTEAFDDLKDYLYFHQRLRHYLNPSSYYKLTVLDVGNPLLDRDILDFVSRLPVRYRIEKELFRHTVSVTFPELADIPTATAASLESWGTLLREDAALRRFVHFHLVRCHTPFHDLFDRPALERYVSDVLDGPGRPPIRTRSVRWLQEALQRVSPPLYQRLKAVAMPHVHVREIPAAQLLLRMASTKLWFDRFSTRRFRDHERLLHTVQPEFADGEGGPRS